MKKTVTTLAVAAFALSQPALAQNHGPAGNGHSGKGQGTQDAAGDTTTNQHFEDSFDNNSRSYDDSNNDNSRYYEDSFDDNSDHFNSQMDMDASSQNVFHADAVVAETSLAGMVTGVDVDFDLTGDSGEIDNHLTNMDNAFQNYSGMNALNQNTGVGASQNASVSIAVSANEFSLN